MLFTFLFFISTMTFASDQFTDIKENDWYREYVLDLVEKGIISGFQDGSFRGDDNISRAEVSKIVSEAIKYIEQNQQRATGNPIQDNTANIVASSMSAIVQVKEGETLGTGFFVEQNKILTAYHVVQDMKKITVVLSNGASYPATLTKQHIANDLALLTINQTLQVKPLKLENNVLLGETIIKIGHGRKEVNTVTRGIVSNLNRTGLIQIDAAVNSGDSGAPILNSEGMVLGLVIRKINDVEIDNIAYAVNSSYIKEFLNN